MDLKNQGIILQWIGRLARETGLMVIFTSHQPQHALAVADDILLLFGPGDAIQGPAQHVLSEPHLERLYGVPIRHVEFAHDCAACASLAPVFPKHHKDLGD